MIRCFDSDDIQNVNPTVDPIRDLEIIETEMMLADFFTKALQGKLYNLYRDVLMGYKPISVLLDAMSIKERFESENTDENNVSEIASRAKENVLKESVGIKKSYKEALLSVE